MTPYVPQELLLQTDQRRTIGVARFGDELSHSGAIIMNYGFPGDVRNYDTAHELANRGYVVYLPHPPGVEKSLGLFTFEDASISFKTVVNYCQQRLPISGVVSYCYSALWVLKALIGLEVHPKLLMLAPILDWRNARAHIETVCEGGFRGFIEESRHGQRQGFYGVRGNADLLIEEYMQS